MSRTPSSSGFDNDFESDSEAGATMSPNAAAANPSAPPSAADAGPQVVVAAAAASATMAGVPSSPKLHAESNTTAAPSPAGPRADGSPVGDAAAGAPTAAAGDGEAARPPPTGPTSDIMNRFKLLNFVQMVAAADVAHCIDAVGLDAIRHIAATEPPVEPTAPELVVGVRTRGYQSNAARRGQTHRGAATVPTASASGLPPSARLVHRAQRNAQDPTNRGPRVAAASRRDASATGRSQPYAREPDPAGMARAMRASPVVASRLGTAHPSPQPAVQRGSFGPPRDSGGTAAPPRPSGGSPPRNGGSVPRAAVDAIAQLMIRERQVREREMAIAQGHPTPPLSSEFLEAHQQQIGEAGHRIAGGARMPDGVSPVTGSGGGAVSPVSSFRPAHSGGRPQAVNFSGLQPPHAHPQQHPYQNPGAVGGPQAAGGFNAPQVFPGAGPYGHPGQPQAHPQQPLTPWQQAAQRAAQHNAQQQGHHGPGLEAYRPGPIVDPHAAAQEDAEPRRSSSSARSPIVDQSFEDEVARTRQEIQPHLNQLGASPHRGGSHPGHGHGQTSAGDSPSKNGRPRPMTAQALAEDRAFERSLHAAGHSPSGRNAKEDAELDRRIDSHQLSPSNGDPFQRSGSGMGSRRGSQGRTPHSGPVRSHSRSPKRGSPSRHGIARGSSQPTSGEATAPNSGRRRPGSRSGHFVVFPHEDALDHEADRNQGTAHQFQQTSQPNSARTPRGRDQFDDRVAHGGGNEELDQFDEEMLSAAEAERLHLRRLRDEEKTRTGVLAEAAAALDAVLYEHDSVVTRQLQYEARKAPLPPLLTHSMGDDAKAAARRGADGASAHQQRDQWTQDQGYADGDSTTHIPRAKADLPPLLPEAEVESAIRAPVRESVKKKPARHRGRMHQKMADSIHRYKEQCVQAAQFNERIWNNSGLSAVTVADQFCDVVMEDLLTEVCVEASAALDECVDGIVDYELQGEHTAAVDDMVARAKSAFAGGPGQGGQTPPSSGRLPPRSQPSPKGAAAIAAAAAKQQAAAIALGLAPAVNTGAIAGLDSIDPSTFGQQRITEEERIRRAAAAADGGDISHVEFESRHPSSAAGIGGAADELGAVTEEERQRREQSMGTLLGRLAMRAHNEIGAPVPEAPFTAFAGDVGPSQPEVAVGTTAGLQATLPSDAGTSPIPDLLSIPPGMISR